MRILCGLDLTPASEPALAASIALARRLPVEEVVLAHAIDLPRSIFKQQALDLARGSAIDLLDSKAQGFPGSIARRSVVVEGKPVDALLELAKSVDANLVVVACGGHGKMPVLRVGGTAERLAAAARVPVLVVRGADALSSWAEGRPLRVVLGCDGGIDAPMQLVRLLRDRGPCEVTAAHVYDPFDASDRYGLSGSPSLYDPDPRIEELIERDLRKRLGPLGDVRVRLAIGIGRKGDHLLQMAAAASADLLVLGARRRRALRRLASTLNVALHFASCSIVAVPQGSVAVEHPRPKRILVASDLSADTGAAVAYAASVAESPAELHVVHVAPRPSADEEPAVAARLRSLAGRDDVQVHVVYAEDVARAIWELAERLGADALVIAAHGHGLVHRALLGSVASDVLRTVRRPVVVLPPAR